MAKNITYIIVAICLGFIVGYICKSSDVQETTITRVDTVRVEVPKPYKVEVVREVSVPIQVPTPADTVVLTRVDSILVQVPVAVERREYRDSTYRAVVSGPRVGELHPSLDYMEVYNRTTTTTIAQKPPLFAPYLTGFGGKDILGIGGGVFIRGHHGVGADYLNVYGKNKWAIRYTYKF